VLVGCRPTVGLHSHTDGWFVKGEDEMVDKRVQRGQATREQLVDVATRLFAERGFDGTSIEAVLEEAGVSRGSLYHHFASKEALFEAAFMAVEARIGAETATAALNEGEAVAGLRAGALEWMRLAGDPVVQRVVLIDAPAVLGWERWRAYEEETALGMIKAAMQVAAEQGRLPAELADAYAHMLLASVNELAMVIARADDQAAAQRSAEAAIDELFSRLLGA
jgi:AcrR family transcriptional regulator